ncbi:MAG: (Fe-S)-binding protein [Saprospiraceae bacterium]|nr:(Fe-S)-binding protein [Saprospiraceae bacterium]
MDIDLFIPCFVDQIYPDTGFSVVKILEKLNVRVHYNPNQTCCGQMAFNSGYWDEAKALGEKLIKEFSNNRYIVGPSASCVGMVRNYYPDLFHNTALHNEYKQVQKKIFEFTDFVVNILKVEDVGATFNHKITIHDSCAAIREYGLKDEPRKLLRNVREMEIIEMQESDTCCGFGGTFSVKHEPISTAMAEQKVENALKTGAEFITSTEASCLMHLEAYINKHKLPIKTIHIADILASGW